MAFYGIHSGHRQDEAGRVPCQPGPGQRPCEVALASRVCEVTRKSEASSTLSIASIADWKAMAVNGKAYVPVADEEGPRSEPEPEPGPGLEPAPESKPEPEYVPPPRWAKWNISDPPTGAELDSFEAALTVNSSNWEAVVEAIANAKGQIMRDGQTCIAFHRSMHASQRALKPGQYRDTFRMAWYCKYWWALKLVQAGYDAVFLDNDCVVISNPWQKVDANKYDLEGLSDFVRGHGIPSPQELLSRPQDCMYKHRRNVSELSGPQNQRLDFEGEDFDKGAAWVMVPCMSTGLWFAHPTRAAALFLDSVIKYLWIQPDEWDQAAVQEVLVAHLLNLNDQAPRLRFRLLPHADYTNLGPYQHELENRRTNEAIIAHPCCVGGGKRPALSEVCHQEQIRACRSHRDAD
ncbi:hypothetical protein WJX73_005218 [Symbiochloris irregularis]|uniref:Nucleotide-diphospho-sugar transferase domain-containing protein n=1 Tax=Symbiochloris irregularis TaxID=706552 RepID=A0AAW1NUF8_9CHLO